MSYKTPGVYVKEISLFPPSVAQVETAIPAFAGYTQKAVGPNNRNLTLVPVKIKSLVEFESLFGGQYTPSSYSVITDSTKNQSVEQVIPNKRFYLYEALRQFYDNGGSNCYVVSVGSFTQDISFNDLNTGIGLFRKYDEPTLLVVPDAVGLIDGSSNPDVVQFAELQKSMLRQCAELQDRFCILDLMQGYLPEDISNTPISNFRDNIGINFLNYAAAYYPWVLTSYNHEVSIRQLHFFDISDLDTEITNLEVYSKDEELPLLADSSEAIAHTNLVTSLNAAPVTVPVTETERLRKEGVSYMEGLLETYRRNLENGSAHLTNTTHYLNILAAIVLSFNRADDDATPESDFSKTVGTFKADEELTTAIRRLVEIEKNASTAPNNLNTRPSVDDLYAGVDQDWFGGVAFGDIAADGTAFPASTAGSLAIIQALKPSSDVILKAWQGLLSSALFYESQAEKALFNSHQFLGGVMEKVVTTMRSLPPSGAVAGVYAKTDATRGVWKAPANISLNAVIGPAVKIDNREQESLNVHSTGKSINAIRHFTGKGTLVWGARTLAGNDNEWRYVPVRRFFIMVEESTKKATAQFVFEPNDANTWVKVRAMIENFLILQWRAGALQGATPAEAFFVKAGLGETMTGQDILEGRMIVEIGMAVVRPAEFIILRFSHKMLSGSE